MRFITSQHAAGRSRCLRPQQVAQHPTAREWMVEMQLIEPTHDCQICHRDRTRLVVNAAPADAQKIRLPSNRQLMRGIDHRFALGRPALSSAPDKKSFSSAKLPDLGVQRLQVHCRRRYSTDRAAAEHPPQHPPASWLFHCVI